MSQWNSWEWIAYAGLWVGALILFADNGLKMSPDLVARYPSLRTLMRRWAFAPLVFVLLSTVILIGHEFNWLPMDTKNDFRFVNEPAHKIIADKEFLNQRVLLDGISYRNCTFTNVTLVYNGTAPFDLTGSHFHGFFVASDNPAIEGVFVLLVGVGLIPKDVPVRGPGATHVSPPEHAP